MKINYISGTKGYADVTQKFIEATIAIDFMELHKDFVQFIPKEASHILDVGAGRFSIFQNGTFCYSSRTYERISNRGLSGLINYKPHIRERRPF